MASGYPAALDTFATTSPTNLGDDDAQARNHAERHDDIGDAMNKVQAELGVDPAGPDHTTVALSLNGRVRRGIPSSGNYLLPGTGHQSGQTCTLNQIVVAPIWVPAPMSVDGLSIYVQTAEASCVLRMGLWENAGGGVDTPGDLLVDAGTVDASSTGAKVATVSTSLTAGLYWYGMVAQTASSTVVVYGVSTAPRLSDGGTVSSKIYGYGLTGVSGALPDPFGTPSNYQVGLPCIGIRRA